MEQQSIRLDSLESEVLTKCEDLATRNTELTTRHNEFKSTQESEREKFMSSIFGLVNQFNQSSKEKESKFDDSIYSKQREGKYLHSSHHWFHK